MKKSTAFRLERLRKARSINDVVSVIQEIAKEVRTSNRVVDALQLSLSATKGNPEADTSSDEITIDHTGVRTPQKVRVGSPTSNTSTLGVKLTNFVIPPLDIIKKHSSVIGDLHDNALELEAAEALVKQAFAKAKNQKQVLSALKALRAEVDNNFQKALGILGNVAHKHLPTEMDQLGDSLVSYLIDHISPKSYKNMEKEVYVSLSDAGDVTFSMYVVVHDLTARTGFTYDEFYVILSGIVNTQGVIHYYLNTMPEFKVPGKFPIGKEITNTQDMTLRISTLIAHNEIVADLERKPMPLTTERAKSGGMKNIPNVDDAYVLDDALFVVVTKGKDFPKNLTAIQGQVIPLLNQLTGNTRGAKGAISQKKFLREGSTVIQFIFTPSGKNTTHTLNLSRLQEVKDMLELSDHEINSLKELLKRKA